MDNWLIFCFFEWNSHSKLNESIYWHKYQHFLRIRKHIETFHTKFLFCCMKIFLLVWNYSLIDLIEDVNFSPLIILLIKRKNYLGEFIFVVEKILFISENLFKFSTFENFEFQIDGDNNRLTQQTQTHEFVSINRWSIHLNFLSLSLLFNNLLLLIDRYSIWFTQKCFVCVCACVYWLLLLDCYVFQIQKHRRWKQEKNSFFPRLLSSQISEFFFILFSLLFSVNHSFKYLFEKSMKCTFGMHV